MVSCSGKIFGNSYLMKVLAGGSGLEGSAVGKADKVIKGVGRRTDGRALFASIRDIQA